MKRTIKHTKTMFEFVIDGKIAASGMFRNKIAALEFWQNVSNFPLDASMIESVAGSTTIEW